MCQLICLSQVYIAVLLTYASMLELQQHAHEGNSRLVHHAGVTKAALKGPLQSKTGSEAHPGVALKLLGVKVIKLVKAVHAS